MNQFIPMGHASEETCEFFLAPEIKKDVEIWIEIGTNKLFKWHDDDPEWKLMLDDTHYRLLTEFEKLLIAFYAAFKAERNTP